MKTKNCELLIVCFIALSVLFFAPPGFAQNGAIQVKCLDSSGNPLAGVKVVIFSLDSQKDKDKKSDAQGVADFGKVDDGVYRVVGRKDGFAPALYEFAQVKGSKESVTLKLAAGADKKLYFEDPAEDQKATDLMRQAFEAYKQNKFEDAEKLFSQSLEINPSNAEAIYFSAVACMQQGKFDRGVEIMKRAVDVAGALKSVPSTTPTGQKAYAQIYQNAQQVLKTMPAIKGERALNQKNYDEAIADFSEAVKSEPNNPEYLANLAISLTNAKRFDEALTTIDKAMKLKPGTYDSLKGQISARRTAAEVEKAQAVMDEGNKLLKDGDAAGAVKKFEEAKNMIAADRQSPLWRQIGRSYEKLNKPDEAIAAFKKSIELAPADKVAEYRNAFAQYYLDDKKYDEAVDVLADPKAAGSENPEQVLLKLAATSKDKQPQLAEAALERVIKMDPGNVDAYFELGQMYYADGKEKDSRTKELLTKYVETGKDTAKVENAKDMLIMVNRRTK